MKDEIKEILNKLKDNDWYEELDLTGTKWIELRQEETNQLLDYITNLQEKNERLKENIEKILNNKREVMIQQMFSGNVDYKELLFQIDEEIREVLQGSDKDE